MVRITGIAISLIFMLSLSSLCMGGRIDDLATHDKVRSPEAVYQAFSIDEASSFSAETTQRGRFIVRFQSPPDINTVRTLEEKALRTAASQSAALERLPGIAASDIQARFRYQNSVAVSVTAEQFAELLESDAVVAIEEDGLNHIATAQGIPLIEATTARSIYTGQGISIAIIDTGIDYTHPMLGGGAFPNSKVIGGYDTGQDDSDPMDLHGHGTACAGIAAGTLSSGSSYIGGVAPNAKLYALKITYSSTGGYALDSDIIEAWEWCVTHQYDNAAYPILVVSTSFGGGKYSGSCDSSSSALAAAANTLAAAGISLFVSAGNDGYCNALEKPACLSNSIAVGAVYDASVGTYSFCVSEDSCLPAGGFASCSSGYKSVRQRTAAGLVTVYSNSGSKLDLFAPSHNATTPDAGGGYKSTFGGTSAAAPYAAGAAAILQQAAKSDTGAYLTPAVLKSKMTSTGTSVKDTKAGISRPLVDLHEAVGSIVGAAPSVTTNGLGQVDGNWAEVHGSVQSDSWTSITRRGVCVNEAGSPTLSDICAGAGSGSGGFSVSVLGLKVSTVYYGRAYGTNSVGTRYGSQLTFTTSATITPPPEPAPEPGPGPSPPPTPPPPPNHGVKLFFHQEETGQAAYWNVEGSGKLKNHDQGDGWGYVSDTQQLGTDWRLNGSLELDGTHTLYWQNKASGEVLYWKIASDGSLLNRTEGDGWGRVAESVNVPEEWEIVGFATIGGQYTIIWQNQEQGEVAYWRIATDGRLKNATEGDGWGMVSESLRVGSAWRLADILEIGGQQTLIWQNQTNGKVVYWRLEDDATLKNKTQGDGWDFVTDSMKVKSNWRLAGGAAVGGEQTLVWHNEASGKVVFWRLNDGARLVNESRGEGWDFISGEVTVPSGWRLAGVVQLGAGYSLIWQNQGMGRNVYWHIGDDARLRNRTRNDGWGFVSEELQLPPAWRLGAIAQE